MPRADEIALEESVRRQEREWHRGFVSPTEGFPNLDAALEQRAGLALIAAPARRAHPEVTEATGRFERINQTLENALKAGYLSAAQEKSIANNFAGIAAALEKGAGSKR